MMLVLAVDYLLEVDHQFEEGVFVGLDYGVLGENGIDFLFDVVEGFSVWNKVEIFNYVL